MPSDDNSLSALEETLKQLEAEGARYRYALQAAGVGIWHWDTQHNSIHWSERMGSLYGLGAGAQIGSLEAFMALVHPDDRVAVDKAIQGAFETQQDYNIEFRAIRPDGTLHWQLAKGQILTDETGRVTGLIGIGMDISERKTLERTLLERESHYHFTLRQTDTCTWERDFVNERMVWSSETYALFGLPPDTPPSHALWESRLHPDDVQHEREVFRRIIAERHKTFDDEFRIIHPNKGVRWLMSRGAVTYAPDGTPLRMVGLNSDITQRKRLEAERNSLLEAERQAHQEADVANNRLAFLARASHLLGSSLEYEVTLRQLAELVVPELTDWCLIDVVTADGRLSRVASSHADPAKQTLIEDYGRRYPSKPGSSVGAYAVMQNGQSAYYPQLDPDALQAAMRDDTQTQHLLQLGMNACVIVPLRTHYHIVGVMTLVQSESGRSFSPDDLLFAEELGRRAAVAVENARLFAEARRLNEDLEARVRERTGELERLNAELESFSYSVSHDLRAPLRSVGGFSQALLEDYADTLDDMGRSYLKRIVSSSQRMGVLIEGILNLSRVTKAPLKRNLVNLSDIAEELLEDLQRADPERQVTVKLQEDLHVQADTGLLRQVMQNLLENAWKFTGKKDDARIEVGCRHGVYYVRDNGAGFNMEYSERLFKTFQRLHSAQDFSGTGIGLALVKRIIERHDGKIWAESVEGEGSSFYFTLPKPVSQDSKQP